MPSIITSTSEYSLHFLYNISRRIWYTNVKSYILVLLILCPKLLLLTWWKIMVSWLLTPFTVLYGTMHSSCQFSNLLWGANPIICAVTSHRPPLCHAILIDHLFHLHFFHILNYRNFYNDMLHCRGEYVQECKQQFRLIASWPMIKFKFLFILLTYQAWDMPLHWLLMDALIVVVVFVILLPYLDCSILLTMLMLGHRHIFICTGNALGSL